MEGLNKFREAFEAYSDNYVIIGGTACEITMTNTVMRSRATHDIDMIVIVEKMTADFSEHFWQFIREGGYRPEKRKTRKGDTPKYELYRFIDGKSGYPEMIELLSRHPDILGEPKGLTIEPLPRYSRVKDERKLFSTFFLAFTGWMVVFLPRGLWVMG